MRCWPCFLADHNKTLWLSLAARNSGSRPSDLAGIDDDIAALDFDLACAFRLEIYDNDKLKTQAKRIAYEVSKIFGDGSEDDDGDEAASSDRFKESKAEVW